MLSYWAIHSNKKGCPLRAAITPVERWQSNSKGTIRWSSKKGSKRFFIDRFPEFRLNNKDQIVGGDIRVLPKEYFTVPSFDSTKNFGVNQCANSWNPNTKSSLLSKVVRALFGDVIYFKLLNVKMVWKSDYIPLERARRKK